MLIRHDASGQESGTGTPWWKILIGKTALLILRVLETIAQPAGELIATLEEVIALLPVTIREALAQGNEAAFRASAVEALSPEEQQTVLAAIEYLQAQVGEESEQEE